ncbi:MAG: class I SAM-dependent methyltransferase [Nitrospira sp.]|nr:class I SAM-dependent methyltransferase [Nitrospira sp.]
MIVDHRLKSYRAIWDAKPVLRAIYQDYYSRMMAACTRGRTLEIGSGAGNLKEVGRHVISTDVLQTPWIDAVADAHALPFADGSFGNIVMLDVLHHLQCPRDFFTEAQRLLRPGGRVVMLEPAITPISWPCYRYLHQEPVRFDQDPLAHYVVNLARDPYQANQAIPTLLFGRHRRRFEREFPSFHLECVERLSLLAYPMSGGFRPWNALPVWLVRALIRLEDLLTPVLGPLMAFRLFVVLVKK